MVYIYIEKHKTRKLNQICILFHIISYYNILYCFSHLLFVGVIGACVSICLRFGGMLFNLLAFWLHVLCCAAFARYLLSCLAAVGSCIYLRLRFGGIICSSLICLLLGGMILICLRLLCMFSCWTIL